MSFHNPCSAILQSATGYLCAMIALLAGTTSSVGQGVTVPPFPSAPAAPVSAEAGISEEITAMQLRNQPPREYEFNRASLRDVIRFLADDAGISFISVPDAAIPEDNLVTFKLNASPFRALEIVAKANGVALFFEDGVWYLRPFDDRQLIGRTYLLKYNTQEKVTFDEGAAAPSTQTQAGASSGGNVPDLGLSLTGPANVFKTDTQQLLDDIKSLLGIPTTGFAARIAPEATVDNSLPLGITPDSVEARAFRGQQGADVAGEPGGPQVIFNPDSNTLYIVATRQQHEWVEGYLTSMDRPQPLIAIEVKFFETTRDPRSQLGIDWSGTFGDGLTVAARQITVAPNGSVNVRTAETTVETNDDTRESESGLFPPGQFPFDITGRVRNNENDTVSESIATFSAPYSAVLTASDLAVTLRAFDNDRDTTMTSYPRVLTRNNREVVIRSVINQPVLTSSSSVNSGIGTGTETSSVSYLPIGTIINVLPKTMPDGSIVLNLAVTISNIIGFEPIAGNPYPIASTRVYNAALEVDSGFTLAIGGLEEAKETDIDNGIPFLKDIPVLGYAFKSKDRSQEKKNLMIFITPTVLPSANDRVIVESAKGYGPVIGTLDTPAGLPPKPVSTIPVRPGDPTPPSFTVDGRLLGGPKGFQEAVLWLRRQKYYVAELIRETRADEGTIHHLESLISTCEMLMVQGESMASSSPSMAPQIEIGLTQLPALAADFEALILQARNSIISM